MTIPTQTPAENRVHDLRTLEGKLAQTRDELRLKAHLMRADVRDEWITLEEKWGRFEARLHPLRDAAEEVGEEVWKKTKALGREIGKGYEKIRQAL